MGGRLDPAVAAVRTAVRRELRDLKPGTVVAVGCSGGADSLALAEAARYVSRAAGWQLSAIVVDHGLQAGSAQVAAAAGERLGRLGYDDVAVETVAVDQRGSGPEGAARSARRAAFARHLERRASLHPGTTPVLLLGHTRDDQAEQVLLGLARGSGSRSLAGIPPRAALDGGSAGEIRRPLLSVDRTTTDQACEALGLEPWSDPHNNDTRFARVRVRHEILPVLERELGPGVADALARTARLARDDADYLDERADEAYAASRCPADDAGRADTPAVALRLDPLQALPRAVRTRVLRRAALDAGAPATELTARHVDEVDGLLTDWRGQGPLHLPGPVEVHRVREADGALLRLRHTRPG